jgi:hypothetical protein
VCSSTGRQKIRVALLPTSGDEKHLYLTGEKNSPSNLRHEVANWHGLDELVLSLLASNRELRPASAIAVTDRLGAIRTAVQVQSYVQIT